MKRLGLIGILTVLTTCLFCGQIAVVAAEPSGSTHFVQGQVLNGTKGIVVPSGHKVMLHFGGRDEFETMETTTENNGFFSFRLIKLDSDKAYGISTIYGSVFYSTDIDISSGSTPFTTLTVYESSDEIGILQVTSISVLYAQANKITQTVKALEIVVVANNSDLTFVPGQSPMSLLRFGLPPKSDQLQVDTSLFGSDYVQVDRGFGLSAPIPPGVHEVMFSYRFPYSDEEVVVDRMLRYGAASLRVLALPDLMTLSSNDLGGTTIVDIGDRGYQLLNMAEIPKGGKVSWRLGDLPSASWKDKLSHRFSVAHYEYIAPGILVVLMLVILVTVVWNRRNNRIDVHESSLEGTHNVKQPLILYLRELELRYERGLLSKPEYQALKSKVTEMIESLNLKT